MSSARQPTARFESATGAGYRPSLMPSHHVVFPTGKTARTVGNRTMPVFGRLFDGRHFLLTAAAAEEPAEALLFLSADFIFGLLRLETMQAE